MEYCYEHKANNEHFKNLDTRVENLEEGYERMLVLTTKIDTLVKSIQKLMWIMIAAMVTVIASGFVPH